jgi:hypothetical protein
MVVDAFTGLIAPAKIKIAMNWDFFISLPNVEDEHR